MTLFERLVLRSLIMLLALAAGNSRPRPVVEVLRYEMEKALNGETPE